MGRVDPLLSAYREATELYFQVSDMPPEVAACFLALACEGRDLVRSSVQALRDDDRSAVTNPLGGASSVGRAIATTLRRFLDATTTERTRDIINCVPPAHDATRERTLVELIKLDQKSRWPQRRPKPLEIYLREWPELRDSRVLVEELLKSDGGRTAAVPHVYLVKRLNSRWWAGLGFNAPFGLGTDYGETWAGRYFATETTLKVFNINPAFALRPSSRVAIGFGLDLQRSTATLANTIDLGSIGAAAGLPLTPQGVDGRIEFSGGDWASGFDLSVAWDAARSTRVGATYRSRIDHTLRGPADFTVPPEAAPMTAGGRLFADTGASTVLPMPRELSVSASRVLPGGWLLLGDTTWTGWSRFQELRVSFDNPSQPDVRQPAGWRDSMRFAAGARKTFTANWTLSTGVGYETTPVPDLTRNARLPEENHAWFSAGTSYQPSDSLRLDFHASHLVTPDAEIRLNDSSAGRLVGNVHWRLNVFGASAALRF